MFFILTGGHFLIAFLVREEGREIWRERNIDVREKHQSVAFLYASQLGTESTTWVCALTRYQTSNLLIYRTTFQPAEPHWPVSSSFLPLYGLSFLSLEIISFLKSKARISTLLRCCSKSVITHYMYLTLHNTMYNIT